jgi:hypothetical protein
MSPNNPRASPKIRIRMTPTYIKGCCPTARTPASPVIPIAKPAARLLKPQHKPAANNLYPKFIAVFESFKPVMVFAVF